MPELPEVETIKNDLKKVILNKEITKVELLDKKVTSNPEKFIKILKSNKIKNILRIGKLLILEIKNNLFLLIHLKMTGQLIYCANNKCVAGGPARQSAGASRRLAGGPARQSAGASRRLAGGHEIGNEKKNSNKYTRAIFKFKNVGELYFNDLRRFGYLKIVDGNELEKIKQNYGIEPLTKNFKSEDFKKIFKNRKTSIKALLLNQKLISGIGNIYADEILFRAGIKPSRRVNTLNQNEIKKIFKYAPLVLGQAIKLRGTTFSDYVDSSGQKGNFTRFLRVYGREGRKCYKCKNIIKKIKLGGRGTRYCEECQK